MTTSSNRIIGERSGSKHGPLLVVLTQIHGNEPAGFLAIQEVFAAIDEEYKVKPSFDYRGKILALRGNLAAAELGQRYIDQDLNRMWTPEKVASIEQKLSLHQSINNEERQLFEILSIIHQAVEDYQPTKLVVLDLHTTTAHGGIFLIPANNEKSRQLGLQIHAPVLHGFLDDLQGTVLHYFTDENFPHIDTTTICFESGQHDSPDSVKHAASAIIQCFQAIDGFYLEDIEIKHSKLIKKGAVGLPHEAKLVYVHSIKEEDEFKMRSDKIYRNFDPIEIGELLATDINGPVYAPYSGLILMPLYQKQGSDGFFIIQDMDKEAPKLQGQIPETTLKA